jgi:hypothetical protein
LEFTNYTLADLTRFVESGEYLNDEVVPITPLRVISQQKNPKARPDDVVLTIAFSTDRKILGYIGALPDSVGDERAAWNSCWWVEQGAPAQVSMKLFFLFVTNWNNKVLFSEMTPHTFAIVEKLKFCKLIVTKGFKGYYRFSMADVLIRKKPVLSKIKGALKVADNVLNAGIAVRDYFALNRFKTVLFIEKTFLLDESDMQLISKYNQHQPAKRDFVDFKWISECPWLTTSDSNGIENRYYFSCKVNRFYTSWVRFLREGELVALVYYTIRDHALKIPYLFCDHELVPDIAHYFIQLIRNDKSISTITTFHRGLSDFYSKKRNFVYQSYLPKYSAISNSLLADLPFDELEFQMGDGDCVFT